MKSLLSQIPPKRIVLYAIGIAMLPMILSYLYVDNLLSEARNNQMDLAGIHEKVSKKILYRRNNRQIMEQYKNTDPLYIHKKVESIALMQEEVSFLQKQLAKSTLPEDAALDRRLQSLLRSDNRCVFLESAAEVGSGYKQVVESLSKPVEMDNADISKVLTSLESEEENSQDRPHLIISDAQFDRKKNTVGDSWTVFLKVIRREYTL